jgi:hypothetical protein
MLRWLFVSMLVAVVAARSGAQDRPPAPSGAPPEIMLAQATVKDGRIVVQFSMPHFIEKHVTVEVERDGKKAPETRTVKESIWFDIDVTVDGKEVEVFGVDGKAIDPMDLPKRLAKPTQVAVVRY